jgi:hypothetical protein
MKRKLVFSFGILAAIVCFISIALWIRSYYVQDWFQFWHDDWGIELWSDSGQLHADSPRDYSRVGFGNTWGDVVLPAQHEVISGLTFGFARSSGDVVMPDGTEVGQYGIYWCPHWAIVSSSGLLALIMFWYAEPWRTWIERKRRRQGRCVRCGYSRLGITAECPECGLSP